LQIQEKGLYQFGWKVNLDAVVESSYHHHSTQQQLSCLDNNQIYNQLPTNPHPVLIRKMVGCGNLFRISQVNKMQTIDFKLINIILHYTTCFLSWNHPLLAKYNLFYLVTHSIYSCPHPLPKLTQPHRGGFALAPFSVSNCHC
jgi:hypothetical protein